VAAALVLFWLLPGQPWWYALGLLPIVPILAFSGYLEFRDAGWAIDAEERLIIRRRSIDRITTITPRRRVQTRTLSQSLFQRRADLASLRVRLAGGSARSSMTLVHLDQSTALSVVDRLGPSRDTDPDPPALNANV
jgi:putative membrane protein